MKWEKDKKGGDGQTHSKACPGHSVNKYLLSTYFIPAPLFKGNNL